MKERRKIEVKKKKIRRCIFALWCILAIIFLIAVNIYNGNEKAENVISKKYGTNIHRCIIYNNRNNI